MTWPSVGEGNVNEAAIGLLFLYSRQKEVTLKEHKTLKISMGGL